jgi:hypothetical protein
MRIGRFTLQNNFAFHTAYGFTETCGPAAFGPSRRCGGIPRADRRTHMASSAVSSHINALQAKHADLDAQLHQELARPVPDTATIQALKKQKLRLKEEIVGF